jgi:putative flippase GtrA
MCAVLIPAYCPNAALIPLIRELIRELQGTRPDVIVVVDDGSGPDYQALFDEVRQIRGAHLLRHAINLGKGAALKTGINYILCNWPSTPGIVTADADGQHHPDDILKVERRFLQSPGSIVLGARSFEGQVPVRSRIGNAATRGILRLVLGHNVHDTQTGLRAIPAALLPTLLTIRATGYEFELEMLIAAKHLGIAVVEEPIRTIYEPGNRSSHFNPLLDSMRIYFVLLRFSMISLMTAAIDNAVFFAMLSFSGHLLQSQICGRAVAVIFNYTMVRKSVFHSGRRHAVVLPRYLMLVAASGSLSYAAILFLTARFSLPVITAKIMAETVLFFGNFALQRDFIFTRRQTDRAGQ